MICKRDGCDQTVPAYRHSRTCCELCSWIENGQSHILARLRRARQLNDTDAVKRMDAEWDAMIDIVLAVDRYRTLRALGPT